MKENYFMGLDGFVWFVGVVENRNDPAKLGRVQVRCLGFHTEDLEQLPTSSLPWAHVMHPVTDPSMQGLGNTPTFLVEGSWVVGFFRDANEKQQPIIMGSLPGYPQEAAVSGVGFSDPNAKYPSTISHSDHTLKESDVSRLARDGDADSHKSLSSRKDAVIPSIPTAIKPNIPSVSTNTSEETRGTFDEPTPRGTSPTGQYPFNHVHESESGHISEIDDTPGGERLLRQHKSGTYEEIIADGSRTFKVKGSNYELIGNGSNILVNGNVNMTVKGNKRELITGDYILEVNGDFTRKIGNNEQVKIGSLGAGNLEEVIKGSHAFNIEGSVKGGIGTDSDSISRDYDINIGGNETRFIGGLLAITATDNFTMISNEGKTLLAGAKLVGINSFDGIVSVVSSGIMNVKSGGNMFIKSSAVGSMIFAGSGSTINLSGSGSTITTTQEVTADTISLTSHTHIDGPGILPLVTTPPNA